MRKVLSYKVRDVAPYINWAYFFHAWQMNGKPQAERELLKKDAEVMLRQFDESFSTHAVFRLFDANSDGDDIMVEGVRMPMLRQQRPSKGSGWCLCLADFVRPVSMGTADRIGLFATTVDALMECPHEDDPYQKMLAQTLADRLAEATAERLHQEVRKSFWGYAPDEDLTISQMQTEEFQGIRPAVGYPSLPDTSVNFIIDKLIDMGEIGIRLTENGAMRPHASVSGLMIAHPKAHYFDLGKIGDDQLADYANRRGMPLVMARKFLASNLDN